MEDFEDLFTARQTVALNTFADLVHEARNEIESNAIAAGFTPDKVPLRNAGAGAKAYAEAVSVYLAFVVDKCSDYNSSICSWIPQLGAVRNTFARQAIPMVWDFVEVNIFSGKVGSFGSMSVWVEKALGGFVPAAEGQVKQMDAQSLSMLPGSVISTDPPYYDNISYADLSDFFYCWLRPSLKKSTQTFLVFSPRPKQMNSLQRRTAITEGRWQQRSFFLMG